MAVMNFGEMREFIRAKVLDMDETNYGLDEPQLGREVNAAYHDYMVKVDKSIGQLFTLAGTNASPNRFGLLNYEYDIIPAAPYPRNIIMAKAYTLQSLSVVSVVERMEVPELRSIIEGSLTVAGVSPLDTMPRFWALHQVYGSPISYKLYIYPDNNTDAVVCFYGQRSPADLVDDDDTPAVTEPEAYWIGMIAAVRVATLLGRASQPGFIEGLIRDLPDDIVLAMGLQQQFTRPRPRQGEEPV
jgi:hypothetical protein